MNETMLQRMARTLYEIAVANGGAPSGPDDLLADAHKLLEAMRDPTENMAAAGAEAVPGDEPAIHSEVAKDVWRMMIEDALSGDDG